MTYLVEIKNWRKDVIGYLDIVATNKKDARYLAHYNGLKTNQFFPNLGEKIGKAYEHYTECVFNYDDDYNVENVVIFK